MRVCLPQDDLSNRARAAQLASSREAYRYAYDWPKGVATCAELQKADQYGAAYVVKSAGIYVDIGANLARLALEGLAHVDFVGAMKARFAELQPHELHAHIFTLPQELAEGIPAHRFPKSWRDYAALFQVWQKPEVVAAFDDDAKLDVAFAWQRVGGVNPMVLARCATLPAHFPVDESRYARVMAGDSLQAAAAEGRLYLADYAVLDGIRTGETDGLQKYVAAPMALFAVDKGSGILRPVAIQCGQSPDSAMVSPGEGWRWRMAMALVQMADANVHEGSAHLGRTHLVMEAVHLAMERQLAQAHPLYVLLKAHVETTFAINHSAKTSLIAPGGTVDRCFAPHIEAFCDFVHATIQGYPLAETDPARDLAARGLDDAEALPQHPYRDDALLLWDAIAVFVREYVGLYYISDADVAADAELRAFVAELSAEDGGRLKGVPKADTLDGLCYLLTRLIFIAGPQHSAVNFSQFPFMSYVPNMPGAAYQPTLKPGDEVDEAAYTRMFPPWRVSVEGDTMLYLLSNMRNTTLGDYGLLRFLDLRVHPVVRRFQARLAEVEVLVGERDVSRLMSYPYLRPSQVLQSISI